MAALAVYVALAVLFVFAAEPLVPAAASVDAVPVVAFAAFGLAFHEASVPASAPEAAAFVGIPENVCLGGAAAFRPEFVPVLHYLNCSERTLKPC